MQCIAKQSWDNNTLMLLAVSITMAGKIKVREEENETVASHPLN